MEKLIAKGVNVVIYEPKLGNLQEYFGVKVVTDIVEFKNQCSVILANRMFSELDDVKDKVYTRDLYGKD